MPREVLSWVQTLTYSKAYGEETWLLLRLAEDLAGCAGRQNARVGGGVIMAFLEISKEGRGGHAVWSRVRFLASSPWKGHV